MRSLKFMAVISILVLISAGCAKDETPIRIGTNAWPPCEIWSVAQQEDLFGSIPVDIIRFSTWSDNMSSLYKGNIDITHATYFNAVYYHDKGEDGVIILSSDTVKGSDGLVVKDSFVNASGLEPDKIRGCMLAVEINTDEHFLLKKALENFGLSEEDIEISSMSSAEAAQAFISGDVDAAFVYEPFLSSAAAKGGGRVVWTTESLPGYMIDVLVARREVLETRKKDVEKILTAWYGAQDFIKDNPDEAFAAMALNEDMSKADFQDFYESFTFFTLQDNLEIFNSESFNDRLAEMNDFLKDHNAINSKADTGALYTDNVVKALIR